MKPVNEAHVATIIGIAKAICNLGSGLVPRQFGMAIAICIIESRDTTGYELSRDCH